MLASVIISVRDDVRIKNCLESLFSDRIAGAEGPVEVIVIENTPTPWLKEIVSAFPATYLTEPRKGMGNARATGLKAATGEFIVFTDADCVVSPGWLSKMLAPFKDGSVGIVGGPIKKYYPESFVERFQRDLVIGGQTALQYLPPIYPRPYVVTANAAYRACAVQAAGGIDPEFFTCGDVDLAWRIGDLGYRAVIAPDAVVYHACRSSRRAVFRQFYTYSIGHALLFKKFGRKNRLGCFNSYPFLGLARALPAYVASSAFGITNRKFRARAATLSFRLIEYAALIAGAIAGSWRFKVIYI